MGDSRATAKRLFSTHTWHSDETTRHNRHLSPKTEFLRFGTMKTRKGQEKTQKYATWKVKTAGRRGENHKEIQGNRAKRLLLLASNRTVEPSNSFLLFKALWEFLRMMCVFETMFSGVKLQKLSYISYISYIIFSDTSDCIYNTYIIKYIVCYFIIYI